MWNDVNGALNVAGFSFKFIFENICASYFIQFGVKRRFFYAILIYTAIID